MDQKDIVDERQQNIKEIADMMSKVNEISKEMNQLIHKQDEGLNDILQTQNNIHNNARTATKDLVEADDLTKKKLKKIAIWAIAVILLGLCIVGLVYILKGNKKNDDPKVGILGSQGPGNCTHVHLHFHGLEGGQSDGKRSFLVKHFWSPEMGSASHVVHTSII